MNMELNAKVVNVLSEQSGQGKSGEWFKCGFVVEWQDNNYTKHLCLEVMGRDRWEKMRQNVVVGSTVQVRFDLSSREYNGRWFTTASCFYCASVGGNGQQNVQSANASNQQQSNAPQQSQEQPQTQQVEKKEDDLPF